MRLTRFRIEDRVFRIVLRILLVLGILYFAWEDDRYISGVSEMQLPGVYATEGWKDTLKVFSDGRTERFQYDSGILKEHYEGNWHYILEDRYSVAIDIYYREVLPEKNIFTGRIRLAFGNLIYYKL